MEIVDAMDPLVTANTRPITVLKYGMDGVYRMRGARERARKREVIRKLEKKNLIKIKKNADQYIAILTNEGRAQAFRLMIQHSDMLPNDAVCMVVFDIPESQRKLRSMIRDLLKGSGFIPIQRSVWISPFDAADALEKFFHEKKIRKWVRIFTAKESSLPH